MPVDPLQHLRVGFAKTRPYLERLRQHDPTRISRISERDGYVYPMTSRKILRRVLDHTLDHLNQIDQWTEWQSEGVHHDRLTTGRRRASLSTKTTCPHRDRAVRLAVSHRSCDRADHASSGAAI
jgi:hypothetical protein